MRTKEEIQNMRKTNTRIYPMYKKIAWDYLFFYTIDFLFLTQIKHINPADIVMVSSIGSLFGIFLQIPANVMVEFLGRKNSILLANVLNCLYMLMFMMAGNVLDLILAKFISSLSFSIKKIAEPSLLNASIAPSKYKSSIFAKINAKGAQGYYLLGAFSKIVAGVLFAINGYLPIICSFIVLVIATIMAIGYIEPVEKQKKDKIDGKKQLKEIEEGLKYALSSERVKALIVASALIGSLLNILLNYHTNLLQEIEMPSVMIGFVSAMLSFVSAYASKSQNQFHNRFKNKSMVTIAFMISISTIIAGIVGTRENHGIAVMIVVVLSYIVAKFAHGMFYTIEDRYIRNFTNKQIDTKIFAVKSLIGSGVSAMMGFLASFLLSKLSISYCMIVVGVFYTMLFIILKGYMKKRVGKNPEEYSKQERKYDELKEMIN